MDGIHDLGGMEGFGPIQIEENEPTFHHDWEPRVMAMRLLMGFWRKWNIDVSRHSVETLPPEDYLNLTYYEKWLASLTVLMFRAGFVSLDEIASGLPTPGSDKLTPPANAAQAMAFLPLGRPSHRDIDAKPAYAIGSQVRTAQHMHSGHHRLPRYVRGHVGEIILHHGAHVLPDTHAKLVGENPQHLYTVRFKARDLWGDEANANDTITVDLWEGYFDAAG